MCLRNGPALISLAAKFGDEIQSTAVEPLIILPCSWKSERHTLIAAKAER